MITATGQHYPEGFGIDSYPDHRLAVQPDGSIIRIETTPPGGETIAPLGDAGISLELDHDNARALAIKLLELTGYSVSLDTMSGELHVELAES